MRVRVRVRVGERRGAELLRPARILARRAAAAVAVAVRGGRCCVDAARVARGARVRHLGRELDVRDRLARLAHVRAVDRGEPGEGQGWVAVGVAARVMGWRRAW